MTKLTPLDLEFKNYVSGKLPAGFLYESRDQELVDFYNEDAEKMQKESITKVIDVFYKERLIAYYAFATSEIKYEHLLPADKCARVAHPAIKLGRLLVCNSTRRSGIGTAILQHLARQALDIRVKIPLRFLFVDSLPHAVDFYIKQGFIDSTIKRGSQRDLSLLYMDLNKIMERLESR